MAIQPTTFHFETLKRDTRRIIDVLGYINEHEQPFVPTHYDGGNLIPPGGDPEGPGQPLSTVCIFEWRENSADLPSFEHDLERLAQERVDPIWSSLLDLTRIDYETAAQADPWLRFNEVDFVPFLGHVIGPEGVRCFAGYNHELVISDALHDDPLTPAPSDDGAVAKQGAHYLELRAKVEECLSFFASECMMWGLLPYITKPVQEIDPEPPLVAPYGRVNQAWSQVESAQFDYDYEDEMITQTPSAVLADSAMEEFQEWKKKKASPGSATKSKRRRRRRR